MSEAQPKVGVGVFVFREGQFLMQKRTGAHGEGTWSVPGGKLDFGETPEQTAHREVMEETGCEVGNVRFAAVTNDIFEQENQHYVTLWMTSDWQANEPTIREQEKCTEQMWADFDSLPEPLFGPWERLLSSEFVDGIKVRLAKTAMEGGEL